MEFTINEKNGVKKCSFPDLKGFFGHFLLLASLSKTQGLVNDDLSGGGGEYPYNSDLRMIPTFLGVT